MKTVNKEKRKGSRANENPFKMKDLFDKETVLELSKHLPENNATEKVQKYNKKGLVTPL